jgi:bifunctional non-homologous end joining protein LigD
MMAVPGVLPAPDEDAQWGYELKWDGVRAVAYLDGGPLRLMSRNDRDVARSYPELAGLPAAVAPTRCVLDGEIVAFDHEGRTSFGRLQERMHVQDPAAARRLAERVPVVYLVFDVLHVDSESTVSLPYRDRRRRLDDLAVDGPAWQVPPFFAGGGQDVLQASREQRMEGVLAKRLASVYRPGQRSPDWRKIKHVRTQEVVIAGWRPGGGRRAGMIGSLILGVNHDDGLHFVGGVGTGFTQRMLADLARTLAPLARERPPFVHPLTTAEARDARWVSPTLVGEVAFAEWTHDGHLRHPSWRGLRPDKSAGDVRVEPQPPSP